MVTIWEHFLNAFHLPASDDFVLLLRHRFIGTLETHVSLRNGNSEPRRSLFSLPLPLPLARASFVLANGRCFYLPKTGCCIFSSELKTFNFIINSTTKTLYAITVYIIGTNRYIQMFSFVFSENHDRHYQRCETQKLILFEQR